MGRKPDVALRVKNAKKVVAILKDADEPIGANKLSEMAGIPKSQLAAAIKYQRRWFLDHPANTNYNYIISTKKGYKMPKNDDEYIAFYQTLYSWTKSIRGTIEAVGRYLEANGYDIKQIRFNSGDGSCPTDELGGEESWHDEVNNGYYDNYEEYIRREMW